MVNKPWLATPHSFTLNMTDGIQKRKEFGRKYGVVVSASGHQPQLLAQICDLTPVTLLIRPVSSSILSLAWLYFYK